MFSKRYKNLDEVDADANKKKKQIVQDLAKDLEGKIRTDRISAEIVHQLHGNGVSERLIRKCLDEKYKEKHRAANTRKQRTKHTEDLAASVPLEQEKPQQQIAVTQDGKSVIINETSSNGERSQEPEEALRKATTLPTADTFLSTGNAISNETPEILNLEFSLPIQYVQQYMAEEYQRGKSEVWFCVKINVKTKDVTAKTGRISN